MERFSPRQSFTIIAILLLGLTALLYSNAKLRSHMAFWKTPEERMIGRALAEFNASIAEFGAVSDATPDDCDFLIDERPRNQSIRVFCAKRLSTTLTAFGNYLFGPDGLFDNALFETRTAPQETL